MIVVVRSSNLIQIRIKSSDDDFVKCFFTVYYSSDNLCFGKFFKLNNTHSIILEILAMDNAAIAITRSRTATSTKLKPMSNVNAITVSQAATIYPPISDFFSTINPATISITPTIIINVEAENGNRLAIEGLMY